MPNSLDSPHSVGELFWGDGLEHTLNEMVARNPGTELNVVLDNLNTHKSEHDHWRQGAA